MYSNFSFFNRIVDVWNSLPLEARSAPTIGIFKARVVNFLLYKLTNFMAGFIVIYGPYN